MPSQQSKGSVFKSDTAHLDRTEDNAFDVTKERVRRVEQKTSAANNGQIPKDSYAAGLQSLVDSKKSGDPSAKTANLDLPEQPGKPSDWQSFDARKTGTGSGALKSSAAGEFERDPVAKDSDVRVDGEAYHKRTLDHTEVGREGDKSSRAR